MAEITEYIGTGRRKTSVARVRLRPGTGRYIIGSKKKDFTEYFGGKASKAFVEQPFRVTDTVGAFDVYANLEGGGTTSGPSAGRGASTRSARRTRARTAKAAL